MYCPVLRVNRRFESRAGTEFYRTQTAVLSDGLAVGKILDKAQILLRIPVYTGQDGSSVYSSGMNLSFKMNLVSVVDVSLSSFSVVHVRVVHTSYP